MRQKQSSTTAEGMALVRAIERQGRKANEFAMIRLPVQWYPDISFSSAN
ncbi:hypothetical protein [Methanosarcina horonobensis]|nr:hypothetical protein [Methanosarcina horonobensis]